MSKFIASFTDQVVSKEVSETNQNKLKEVASMVQLDGFAPKYKKSVTSNGTKLTGIHFHVNPIVKEKWLDYYRGILAGKGFTIRYDNTDEEINIEL